MYFPTKQETFATQRARRERRRELEAQKIRVRSRAITTREGKKYQVEY